jgi:hypothetical protein
MEPYPTISDHPSTRVNTDGGQLHGRAVASRSIEMAVDRGMTNCLVRRPNRSAGGVAGV